MDTTTQWDFLWGTQLKVSLSENLHTDTECGWLEGSFNVTICSRSQYGCHAKIAGSNSVTVRRAGANSVAGRCGKQMPVDTWQACESAVQLFLYHSAQAKWFFYRKCLSKLLEDYRPITLTSYLSPVSVALIKY